MLDHPSRTEGGATFLGSKVPAPGLAPFLAVWTPTSERLEAWNSNAIRVGDEITQSWLKFLSDRFAKDTALPEQLASCQNMNDVFTVYSQFWQQATKDYVSEYLAIANAAWGAVRSSMEAKASRKDG
jgi:hypothetical protein